MQPLYSVDHETRHNASHTETEVEVAEPQSSENTPLLQRFPQEITPRSPFTNLIVCLLLVVFLSGIVIGIYLLVVQSESENILPPVNMPLQLVSRSQWDHGNLSETMQTMSPYRLRQVMVVHTNTRECVNTDTCSKLLQEMKRNATTTKATIPYNFLFSPNGQTYEGLGWLKSSPLSTLPPPYELVLAFIGNFTRVPPSRAQLQQAKTFFAESVSQQYLHPSYTIRGKNENDTPAYLLISLKEFSQ